MCNSLPPHGSYRSAEGLPLPGSQSRSGGTILQLRTPYIKSALVAHLEKSQVSQKLHPNICYGHTNKKNVAHTKCDNIKYSGKCVIIKAEC
jgi:hypothetical protein